MRAMVTTQLGGPDLFEERDVEKPSPGPGEVLVRVMAAGTNPVDAKLRAGDIPGAVEPPAVLGADVSGVVEEVGAGVSDLAPGDEVYYTPELFGPSANGSYAEYNVAPANIVAPKPPSISHEEAAAVPLAGGTAWEAIVRRLAVVPGETILVHGGAGGVGSFAVQIAKAAGARVLATAGAANQGTLKELGADVCLDYTTDDIAGAAAAENGGEGVETLCSIRLAGSWRRRAGTRGPSGGWRRSCRPRETSPWSTSKTRRSTAYFSAASGGGWSRSRA